MIDMPNVWPLGKLKPSSTARCATGRARWTMCLTIQPNASAVINETTMLSERGRRFSIHRIIAISSIQTRSTLVSAKNVILSIRPFKPGIVCTSCSKKLSNSLIQLACIMIEIAKIKKIGKPTQIAVIFFFRIFSSK